MQEVPQDVNQDTQLLQHSEQPNQSIEEPALSKTDSNPYAAAIIKEDEVAAPVSENPFDELIMEEPAQAIEEKKELEEVDL